MEPIMPDNTVILTTNDMDWLAVEPFSQAGDTIARRVYGNRVYGGCEPALVTKVPGER